MTGEIIFHEKSLIFIRIKSGISFVTRMQIEGIELDNSNGYFALFIAIFRR